MATVHYMSDKDWRLEKLRKLVDAQGGPAAFARAWSRNPDLSAIDQTFVSQLLNGHRRFGDRARVNMAQRRLAPEESVTTIGAPLSLSTTEQTGRHQEHDDTPMQVVVTDVRIKFWSMVTLLVKLALAAIPAALILVTAVWMLAMLMPKR